MEIIYKTLDEIKPYANNPRINDSAVEATANSIKEFGFINPVVIDSNNEIVAGHTRIKAAKKLGINKIPCISVSNLTEEQIKAFRLADNKTGELSEWDLDKLGRELIDLEFSVDMSEFGFDIENEFNDISPDDFNDEFELDSGGAPDYHQFSVIVHTNQLELITACIQEIYNNDEITETYGNTNKNGNGLFEIVKQWAEQRKLL